jgi:hypothetical protein
MDRIFGDPEGRNASITWQPEPRGRGTLSVLWSCILTMTLCVWTALHLNVPPPEPLEGSKLRRCCHWLLRVLGGFGRHVPTIDSKEVSALSRPIRAFLRKSGWLLLGVFTPEVVVYVAVSQNIKSRKKTTQEEKGSCREVELY